MIKWWVYLEEAGGNRLVDEEKAEATGFGTRVMVIALGRVQRDLLLMIEADLHTDAIGASVERF